MFPPPRVTPFVVATCALAVAAPHAGAQKVPKSIEFVGAPVCANCGVRLQEIATLGDDANGPGRLEVGAYAFDKKRKLAYVRGTSRAEVNAYDLNGKLQFTVGARDRRPAAGARDFAFALGADDSLWTLDPTQQRVTIYAPGSATPVRSFRVKNKIERILPLKNSEFIGTTSSGDATPDHVLVHRFSVDGKPVVALGAKAAVAGVRPAVALSRDKGMVWIARPDAYAVELWGVDGKQYSTVTRPSSWFTKDAIAKAKKEHRSLPAITDVYEDDSGFLWVVGQKPDPFYKKASGKASTSSATSDELNVLEVLNVPSGKIEFADEVGSPLYRLGGDYFVQPDIKGRIGTWRVVKVSMVKR
jgi:hypothetical protein